MRCGSRCSVGDIGSVSAGGYRADHVCGLHHVCAGRLGSQGGNGCSKRGLRAITRLRLSVDRSPRRIRTRAMCCISAGLWVCRSLATRGHHLGRSATLRGASWRHRSAGST